MDITGKHVIFTDELGKQHDAIVTADWGREVAVESDITPGHYKAINVAYVDMNDGSCDSYGQQIIRKTSVPHRSVMGTCHGMFWTLNSYSK